MNERLKDNYFVFVRILLMLILCVYGIMNMIQTTGVSVWILLLVSFYIGAMTVKEIFDGRGRIYLLLVAILFLCLIIYFGKSTFLMLVFFTVLEVFSLFPKIDFKWYFLPILGSFIESPLGWGTQLVLVAMMVVIYIQHNFVVKDYKKRMQEDVRVEQSLKKDMQRQEYASKEELRKGMLVAQNQILEERANLSQTLHDKLGHNINGSVYQLEGAKLLMDKDPEKSKGMIQAVIDQLRTGMDEIRGILRKERPKKNKLAMLQLYKLCEDCNGRGVEAELTVEGDTALVTDDIWEVILDNAFEAVSNSMKYARCKHIDIKLVVMNKVVRCSITDDGIGCVKMTDGMGISGMRQRVRAVNGSLGFETEAGFTVTMLLPIGER
ncbi:MAG: hypothetical protein IJ141_09310 [Lachnospiraceae bacterium]|nr:hypothetical protein [Lachnospiraceae bacterium]